MDEKSPVPSNELDRLINLSDYDIDFTSLETNFKNLSKLAAKVAGTQISFVNLIDRFTQWTVSSYGSAIKQMPREESVCQYTITENKPFEVTDLSADSRFKSFDYVQGELSLRYYFGIPLTTEEGYNIGALCVLDKEAKEISPEKIELLTIIADEIVSRLKALKTIEHLKIKVKEISDTQKVILHDIRGPVSGIIGLADLVNEQGYNNEMREVLQLTNMIKKSGVAVLDLATEVLNSSRKTGLTLFDSNSSGEFNLIIFKEKLEQLYLPQAIKKNINYQIIISKETEQIPIIKNKLLQIVGNLISNAIKFTPQGGQIAVHLNLDSEIFSNKLTVTVEDTGIGLTKEKIDLILRGKGVSTAGTIGEDGYGLGLVMVNYLVNSLKGTLEIKSTPGKGSIFKVILKGV